MSGERAHEIYARRRARNAAVGWVLGGLVVVLFAVTIVKMQECATSPFYEFFNASVCDDVGAAEALR